MNYLRKLCVLCGYVVLKIVDALVISLLFAKYNYDLLNCKLILVKLNYVKMFLKVKLKLYFCVNKVKL